MREKGRVAKLVFVAVLLVLYAPLVFLVVASVNENPASTAWQGFTTKWYDAAFHDESLRKAVGVSVRLALGASLGSVLVGTLAVLAARRTRWFSRINSLFATVRVATPEIIIATGLGAVLPAVGIAFGFRPMLVAHVAYLSAYVMLIVGARAAGADRGLEEAALDLGAKNWQVLRDIVLPDLRPAIVSSGLLALAFSFDDVALSLALRGPNDTTVPIYIFSAVQRRVTPSIHAIGTVIIIVGIVTFLAATLVHRAVVGSEARHSAGRAQVRP
jgi:spermidine/putrescine transport system permease protein